MPIPPLLMSIGGLFLTVKTMFFLYKLPKILASIGFSFVSYKGLDKLLDYVIQNIRDGSYFGVFTFYGQSVDFLGLASSCGIFDALNIVLSGYSSLAAWIMTNKVLRYVGIET